MGPGRGRSLCCAASCLELEEVLGPCPTWPGAPGCSLAGWAHVTVVPHQSPKGCPACPTSHPWPCCFRGGGAGFCTSAPGTQSQAHAGAVGRLLGTDGATSMSEAPVCPGRQGSPAPSGAPRTSSASAGQHLRSKDLFINESTAAAGRPPAAQFSQPRAAGLGGDALRPGRRGSLTRTAALCQPAVHSGDGWAPGPAGAGPGLTTAWVPGDRQTGAQG